MRRPGRRRLAGASRARAAGGCRTGASGTRNARKLLNERGWRKSETRGRTGSLRKRTASRPPSRRGWNKNAGWLPNKHNWRRQRRQIAAEKARMEQEEREQQRVGSRGPPPAMASPQGRVGPPAAWPAIVPPTFKKTALVAGGIVIAALIVYWATRPKPQQVVTQTPAARNATVQPSALSRSTHRYHRR